MKTAGMVLGILIIAAGITLGLVTGLDWRFSLAGVLVCALGAALVVGIRRHNPIETDDKALTSGRSLQRPPSASEQKQQRFKDKL
jgi:hypothetical protein